MLFIRQKASNDRNLVTGGSGIRLGNGAKSTSEDGSREYFDPEAHLRNINDRELGGHEEFGCLSIG
jgi:hypothetical protein